MSQIKNEDKEKRIKELSAWSYAHRGLHEKPVIPENSMAAFKRAVDEGFGIELDIHLTKDGKLAVIHDSSLLRTAGQNLMIEDLTLEEAKAYNLEESNEKISELSEVLEMNGGRTPFVIEIKAAGGNEVLLTDTAMSVLNEYDGLYCVESFNPLVIKHLRLNYPDVVRGQLAGDLLKPAADTNGASINTGNETSGKEPSKRTLKKAKKEARSQAKEKAGINEIQNIMMARLMVNWWGKPDFVAYHYADINNRAFRSFKGAKFAWTIKSYEEMEDCFSKGIAPIFEQFNPKNYL